MTAQPRNVGCISPCVSGTKLLICVHWWPAPRTHTLCHLAICEETTMAITSSPIRASMLEHNSSFLCRLHQVRL